MRRLGVVALLGFSSFFLTLASLPSWAIRGGVGAGAAGVVTAVMLGCTVAAQSAVPALERRLGIPRLLSLGLVALAAPAPFYLLSHQLWWLSLLSAVRGFGFALLTVIGALLTARVAPPERHGESVGIYGLSIAVPNLVGVPAGAALVLSGHFAWVAVLAAAPLLALPFVAGLGGETPAPRAVPGSVDAPGGSGRAARAVAGPSLVLLVVTLAGGGLVTFLPIARPHGALATVALLAFGVTGTISRYGAARLLRRFGSMVLLGTGLLLGVLGLLTIAVVLREHGGTAAAVLFAGAAVLGLSYGMTQNVTQVIAFDRAGPAHLVTASAVWNAAFDGGTAIGAYAVGAVAAAGLGLPWTYVLCAAVMAAALPLAAAGARGPSPT